MYSRVNSTSAMLPKSNGLAAFGSCSSQLVSTPMLSKGASIPTSGSSSSSPVALLVPVKAICSGSRRTVMVENTSPPVTTREMPDPIRVALRPRSGGTSATTDTPARLTVRR